VGLGSSQAGERSAAGLRHDHFGPFSRDFAGNDVNISTPSASKLIGADAQRHAARHKKCLSNAVLALDTSDEVE
jgi:hypothetical protein